MKKILILLSFSIIFTFLIFNNSKVSAAITDYGTTMTYTTLILYDDFEFTGSWWENSETTYTFEFKPVEESLEELIRTWDDSTSSFMELYHPVEGILPHLENTNSIPTGNLGWTNEDGYLYIIVKKDYFTSPDFILPELGDLAEAIRVDTWIIVESSDDYQNGYNAGYYNGYQEGYINGHNDGFTLGWDESEAYFNEQLPGLLEEEYQRGYDNGLQASQSEAYQRGYTDGANKSFMGTMDKWLVPAIIIVMLLGGYFAIARKKRDGDI